MARQILKMESNNGSYIRKFNQGKQTKIMSNEIKKDIIYNNRIKSQLTNIKYVLFLTALMWYNFFFIT